MLQHYNNVSITVTTMNTTNDSNEEEKNPPNFFLIISLVQAKFILKKYSELKNAKLAIWRVPLHQICDFCQKNLQKEQNN